MADELGARHQIHPYRRANFLTGYANTFPAILPFISAFIFISASSIEPLLEEYSYLPAVTPLQIFSGAFYPMVLFVVLTVSILTGWDRIYEGPDLSLIHIYTVPHYTGKALRGQGRKRGKEAINISYRKINKYHFT